MSPDPAPLHVTTLGEAGRRVLLCHGLFGQGRNWTRIGAALADEHRVVLVDLPDHGASPRSERFDYPALADRVAALAGTDTPSASGAQIPDQPVDPVALVGHSMGGKVAMLAALRHREVVERLVVVDVAPVVYDHAAEFGRYLAAMRAIDLSGLERRDQADTALRDAVPDPTVRGFLLQSLRYDPGAATWRWLLNLDLLDRDLDLITDWPAAAVDGVEPYPGPVLWITGAESPYVRPEHEEAMQQLFPRVRKVTVKGAGHWVHSQRPDVVVEVLRRFLDPARGGAVE